MTEYYSGDLSETTSIASGDNSLDETIDEEVVDLNYKFLSERWYKYYNQYYEINEWFDNLNYDFSGVMELDSLYETLRNCYSSINFMNKLINQKKYTDASKVEKVVKKYVNNMMNEYTIIQETHFADNLDGK